MATKHPYDPKLQLRESEEPLRTVWVRAYCPTCSDGELTGTGYGMSTNRSTWVNRCGDCSDEFWLDHSYPYVAHRKPLPSKDGEKG